MAMLFRHTDRRFGFTWDSADQPAGRWHGVGEGPVQYLADSPDTAWAEFLRSEEITDPDELDGIERRIWVVEVPDAELSAVAHLSAVSPSHDECQTLARSLRTDGSPGLVAPSAALDLAPGWGSSAAGLMPASPGTAWVAAIFGATPHWRGWMCHDSGRPHPSLLSQIRRSA